MATYTPPAALSGGYMLMKLTNGVDTHMVRQHVLPFDTTQYNTAGSISSSDTDGHHNYAYVGPRPGGQEQGINNTFAAFAAAYMALYLSSWALSLQALVKTVSGVDSLVPIVPTPTPVVGTAGALTPADVTRCVQATFSFRTAGGGKARIVAISTRTFPLPIAPAIVTPTSGLAADSQGLVGYVSGAATGIVGHDNQKYLAQAHVAVCLNKRLRRHYGFA